MSVAPLPLEHHADRLRTSLDASVGRNLRRIGDWCFVAHDALAVGLSSIALLSGWRPSGSLSAGAGSPRRGYGPAVSCAAELSHCRSSLSWDGAHCPPSLARATHTLAPPRLLRGLFFVFAMRQNGTAARIGAQAVIKVRLRMLLSRLPCTRHSRAYLSNKSRDANECRGAFALVYLSASWQCAALCAMRNLNP